MTKEGREWHDKHPMKKNATFEERVAWHVEHAKHCGCREMPKSIKEAIEKQKN